MVRIESAVSETETVSSVVLTGLEALSFEEGIRLLSTTYQDLLPGGVVEFTFIDIRCAIEEYHKTRSIERLNALVFRGDLKRLSIWDRASVVKELFKAGFGKIWVSPPAGETPWAVTVKAVKMNIPEYARKSFLGPLGGSRSDVRDGGNG